MDEYLQLLGERKEKVLKFHADHYALIKYVPGSGHNHQHWSGGYHDHLIQCFQIATQLYGMYRRNVSFSLDSVIIVLYFHDVEKLWREKEIDKEEYYTKILPEQYEITFTTEELNALKYIHGEGNDYQKGKRVMNELAALCHACDVLSARCFHNIRVLQLDEGSI